MDWGIWFYFEKDDCWQFQLVFACNVVLSYPICSWEDKKREENMKEGDNGDGDDSDDDGGSDYDV